VQFFAHIQSSSRPLLPYLSSTYAASALATYVPYHKCYKFSQEVRMRFKFTLLLVIVCMATLALADTVSFAPATSGSLGTATKTFTNGSASITATAMYWNGSSWVASDRGLSLYGRNESNDRGIGVCSPGETCTSPGGGTYNELSNEGKPELIRLALQPGWNWSSVRLSSLDNNNGGALEHGMIFAGSSATPLGLAGNLTNATDFCNIKAGATVTVSGGCTLTAGINSVEPSFSIPSGFAGANYLFFEAYDWTSSTQTDNDYLIYSAAITRVPEPGTLALFGSGFIGLLAFRRRKLV
jgi:PEP-CTERM motif